MMQIHILEQEQLDNISLKYTSELGSFRLDDGFMMIWNKFVISDINNLYPRVDWGDTEKKKVI